MILERHAHGFVVMTICHPGFCRKNLRKVASNSHDIGHYHEHPASSGISDSSSGSTGLERNVLTSFQVWNLEVHPKRCDDAAHLKEYYLPSVSV